MSRETKGDGMYVTSEEYTQKCFVLVFACLSPEHLFSLIFSVFVQGSFDTVIDLDPQLMHDKSYFTDF